MSRSLIPSTALLALLLPACAHVTPRVGATGQAVHADHTAPAAAAHHAVHWGYDGDAAPAHWGALTPAYAQCGAGTAQSPIDIPATVPPAPVDGLALGYGTTAVTVTNTGHTIQVDVDPGSTLRYGGKTYALKQLHLHAGSEHTVGGQRAPLELHLVHATDAGELAVIGLLFARGAENTALASVFSHMPREEGAKVVLHGATPDLAGILPTSREAWTYDGSLTTPPCTEGVHWFVMATPIEASPAQIQAFTTLFDHNYRPTQPLHGRAVNAAP